MSGLMENIIFGGSPSNHHLILDYLKKMPDVSLIRVDNHEDLVRSGFGYCLPCADYMRKVFREEYFRNVLWIRANEYYCIRSYESCYKFKDYSFDSLERALDFSSHISQKKIVLDIDPDILADYDTGFSKGSMKRLELAELIDYFFNNKKVELFFLAESRDFLENLLEYQTIKSI